MKEGDTLLETAVGALSDGTFVWHAASPLFTDARFKMPRGYVLAADDHGMLFVGPFATQREADRDLADFVKAFERACTKQFGTTFENLPRPEKQH
jgi:hypothetical protein